MNNGVKRLMRLITIFALNLILFSNLRLAGCNFHSTHSYIFLICYCVILIIVVIECFELRERELEKIFGVSYDYLFKVYGRAKTSVTCHEDILESLKSDTGDFENDDKELLMIINDYGLGISKAILDVEEE